MKVSPTLRSASLLLACLWASTAYPNVENDIAHYVGDCVKPGPYEPLRGRHDVARSTDAEEYYFLNLGFKGVQLWRVLPRDPNLAPYILKEYPGPGKYAQELAAFRGIEEARTAHPDLARQTFAFPTFEPLEKGNALKVSDVRGRSLEAVLKDPRVPRNIKRALRRDYWSKAENLDTLLKTHYGVPAFRFPWFGVTAMSWEIPQPGVEKLAFHLNADQVVVTFNETNPQKFTLTLVDPF